MIPESIAKAIEDRIGKVSIGDQLATLLSPISKIATSVRILHAALAGGSFPVVGPALMGLGMLYAGLPKTETSTQKDVVVRIKRVERDRVRLE